MTCFVPVFGTDRNIPAVPAGTERNLKLWSALQSFLYSATILYNKNVPKIIIYIFQTIVGGGNDLLLLVRKLCTEPSYILSNKK